MQVINHKVYLYKPDGASFLGELIVDNLKVDIKLQDISTIAFRIPEVINGQVNPRVDEVLDSYIIELWYGKVDGVYANGDFEKIRFRIYSTPLDFSDYQYLHSYSGYSLQSDLEFKQIVSWPGIQVKDFFRTITYNKNAATPAFIETGFSYNISTSSNTSSTKYITINTTDNPTALDIFIYEKRTNSATSTESEVSLIELSSGGVNSNDFKAGYYHLNKTGDIVNSVSIALPPNYIDFNGAATATFSYRFYDNPVARAFAVGITTNTETPLNNMYIDLAQDAALGEAAVYEGYTFTTQSIYTKNGLKLNDILTGADTAADGILYNTGFTVGTISNTIAAKYRSNIDFNNITVHQAIKDVAESFEAIPVFDSINKTVSFYAENEYGNNNGLMIKYATYLKSINKEIDASKIVTNARALGKDNIKISLVNPTGLEVWEDYSYFLDDYHIQDTTGFTITADETTGLAITYATTAGFQSRWMDAAEALKVAKWQYTRDYFHTVLSSPSATTVNASHNQYKNLYNLRSAAINLYVKNETQYEKKKANEYKYYYLVEHYRDLYENKGTNLTEYNYYRDKYNTAVAQTAAFKSTDIDPIYDNIYDVDTPGTLAYKFAEVQSFLDKAEWSIDLDKLRTFERESVHNDSKIDTEYDLLDSTKIYVDENKEPRVTLNIGIIDVLEAQEAYQDWDKFVIGDKINIYFPEFNIDLEAQIREISIDFQNKNLSIVISTVRNYNRSFGSYLTKNIRRFHNANLNTVLFYKDGTDASIGQTEENRQILEETGINSTDTSMNSGAVDGVTGESSTTTNGEGQQSRVVTGVDLYTESLLLSAFNKGIKVTDGRILTFRPFNVSGTQWVQEVEVSAENGFVIRRVYANDVVTKLAYIDASNGSAFFAGWKLDPGQFSAGAGASFVGINSETPVADNTLYAFWAGSETASSAAFNVTKAGAIKATDGLIGGWSLNSTRLLKSFDAGLDNDVNIYAGAMPSAITTLGAGGYGFAVENTNPLATEPFIVALTNQGFFVYTDGGASPVTAMEISYNEDYIWAKGLLISDNKNSANANVSIGTLDITDGAASNWGLKVNNGIASNGSSVTIDKDGIEIIKTVSSVSTTTFSVDTAGNVAIKGDLTASTGTFGTVATDKGNVLLGGSDPLIVRNNTTEILKLTNAGVLSVSGFTASSSAFFTGTKSTFASNDAGVYLASDGIALGANSPFNVTSAGVLTASSGTIGGWTLNTDAIFTGTKTATGNYTSTAGHVTIGSDGHISAKEFRIDADGNAFFAGDISAATGTFGASIAIGTGDSIFKADSNGIYLGDADFADAEFSVTPAGLLKATSGTVGGFTIGADFLRSGADNTKLLLKHDATNPFMSIGQSTNSYAQPGIFLGLDSGSEKFSILDSTLVSEITFQEAFTSGSSLNILNGAGTWTTDAAVYNAVGVSPTNGFFNIEDGATTSASTGPDEPYEGNRFLYYESSGTSSLNRDLIFTYTTTSTVLHYISFYYHMFGESTTSLTLFRNGTANANILWRKTGNQGNQWYEATVPVAIGTTTLRFRVVGDGSSFVSDIALDHIRIYSKLNKFSYDPNLGLSLTGNITATSGEIGGFDIGTNQLTAGFSTTRVGISDGSTTDNVALYAGSETATSAPFRVTNAGAVTMTNLDAQGGTIAGWTITNTGNIRIKSPVALWDDGLGSFYNGVSILGAGWLGAVQTDGSGTIGATANYHTIHPSFGFSYHKNISNPLNQAEPTTYYGSSIVDNDTSGSYGISTSGRPFTILTENHEVFIQAGSVTTNQNISLVVNGTGRIRWSINGGSSYTNAQNGTGTVWSSEVIKKDIKPLSQTDIQNFIDKIEIKEFKYKENDKLGISLIIEDEINKNIPLKDILFKRDESGVTYTSLEAIPEHLKQYIGTENFIFNQELNEYTFKPMSYDSNTMLSIAIAVIKKQNNDIKKLQEEIALIKKKLGI